MKVGIAEMKCHLAEKLFTLELASSIPGIVAMLSQVVGIGKRDQTGIKGIRSHKPKTQKLTQCALTSSSKVLSG